MRKILLLIILLCGWFPIIINAQEAVLNINLYPMQTIEVNSVGQNVHLDYKTRADYQNGVNVTVDDQLKISSSGGFVVKVKSATPLLTDTASNTTINTTDITMVASLGTLNSSTQFTAAPVLLSPVNMELLSSASGGANKTFTVNYSANGGDAYLKKQLNSRGPSTYTSQLTFSIEPR